MYSLVADWYDRNGENENDHYTRAGDLFRKVFNNEERTAQVNNFLGSLKGVIGPKREQILNRQLCHFFRADPELGARIAKGFGIHIDESMFTHQA